MIRLGILAHGGVGCPSSESDGCRRAAEKGLELLRRGAPAIDAVVEAVTILEDDGRFNAGSGADLRMDGRTMEMDAAVMDSEGRLGTVAILTDVKNPIRVARRVIDTPHVMLAGEGARAFAEIHGLTSKIEPTPRTVERYRRLVEALRARGFDAERPEWKNFDARANWNFETSFDDVFSCDTVGAVAIDRDGRLAAANSTGGASPMLRGRVGDSPLVGCGFYAGPAAAIVATGVGERIVRAMLSRAVYDEISTGESVARAAQRRLAAMAGDVPIGLLAISRRGWAIKANRDMASWAAVEET